MVKLDKINNGDIISGAFYVQDAQTRHFSNKPGSYLRLRISDDSAIITAICFDPDLLPFQIRQGMHIGIKSAKITQLRGELRMQFLPGSVVRLPDMQQ